MNSSAGIRAQIRTGAGVIGGAITLTAKWLGLDVPGEVWAAWGFAAMAVFGIGEAVYDYKHGR